MVHELPHGGPVPAHGPAEGVTSFFEHLSPRGKVIFVVAGIGVLVVTYLVIRGHVGSSTSQLGTTYPGGSALTGTGAGTTGGLGDTGTAGGAGATGGTTGSTQAPAPINIYYPGATGDGSGSTGSSGTGGDTSASMPAGSGSNNYYYYTVPPTDSGGSSAVSSSGGSSAIAAHNSSPGASTTVEKFSPHMTPNKIVPSSGQRGILVESTKTKGHIGAVAAQPGRTSTQVPSDQKASHLRSIQYNRPRQTPVSGTHAVSRSEGVHTNVASPPKHAATSSHLSLAQTAANQRRAFQHQQTAAAGHNRTAAASSHVNTFLRPSIPHAAQSGGGRVPGAVRPIPGQYAYRPSVVTSRGLSLHLTPASPGKPVQRALTGAPGRNANAIKTVPSSAAPVKAGSSRGTRTPAPPQQPAGLLGLARVKPVGGGEGVRSNPSAVPGPGARSAPVRSAAPTVAPAPAQFTRTPPPAPARTPVKQPPRPAASNARGRRVV